MEARVPPTRITGAYGAIVKRLARHTLGRVPASLGVMWHHLPSLKATLALGQKVQRFDTCDQALKSFAHMAVASQVGCSWCLDFNYFMAHDHGLDLAKAREVPRWQESTVFTPIEREVLAYAEAVTHTPPTVSDAMVVSLRDQLGSTALVELTTVIGFANLTARSNSALGIEAEGFAASCDLAPLAERPGVSSTP